MGFWIFMVCMELLIPITMIGFGRLFMKRPPKMINHLYGYRTSMSMKNEDTWQFAHKLCGKLCLYIGLVLLPLTVIAMAFLFGDSDNIVGTFGGIICGIQGLFLVSTIMIVETKLRKIFDEFGNRRHRE